MEPDRLPYLLLLAEVSGIAASTAGPKHEATALATLLESILSDPTGVPAFDVQDARKRVSAAVLSLRTARDKWKAGTGQWSAVVGQEEALTSILAGIRSSLQAAMGDKP